MFRFCKLALPVIILSFIISVNAVNAQKLTEGTDTQKKQTNGNTQNNSWLSNPRKTPQRNQPMTTPLNRSGYTDVNKENVEGLYLKEVGPKKPTSQTPIPKKQKPQKKYVPQLQRPTLDGVKRGGVAMQPISEDPNFDDRFIFVYYQDFNIRVSMSGTVMCDVRFVVLSTLDRKINNVSFKLNWQNMSTSLSYNNVAPNVDTYFDYTLVGDGCYSMDKAPNIVVNRCRVAGTTQEDCAKRIRWLRK